RLWRSLAAERVESGADHVVGIGRADRLGDHVGYTQAFEHGAHWTAGNDAGARGSRADIDQTGAEMALAVVMQRAAFLERNTDHLLLGCGRRLGDGLGHFARLAVSETDTPLAVTDHDERRKAEALATLHRLRDPVDVDQLLYQFLTAVIVAAATAAFVTTTPTA